jgi:hypothetical protein
LNYFSFFLFIAPLDEISSAKNQKSRWGREKEGEEKKQGLFHQCSQILFDFLAIASS